MDQDASVSSQSHGTPALRPRADEPAPSARPAARRVVVACGEAQLCELVERVLRHRADDFASEGLEVRRVADGLTCLQEIELSRPDLVVLHSQLDRMSPLDILEAWDRSHPGDRLPAIVLSSGFGSDLPRGVPGVAVVNLPFDNAHLIAVVTRALAGEGNA